MTKKKSSTQSKEDILNSFQDLTVVDVDHSMKRTSKKSKFKAVAAIASEEQQMVEDMVLSEHISEDDEQNDRQSRPMLSGRKRKRKKSPVSDDATACYNELHLDVWTVISTYIRPEDVGNFAGICRTTAFVVSRAGFWTSLYNRYCKSFVDMPYELRSWEILNNGVAGLRSRVVRSLFLAYDPLAKTRDTAIVKSVSVRDGPAGYPAFCVDRLRHSSCTVFWHKRRGCCHQYVFRLYHSNRIPNQALFGREFWLSSPSMTVSPACQHPDDGSFLLEVICSSPCKVDPSIIGLKLQLICEKPSEITNCSKNKITLIFSECTYTQNTRWDEGVKVVLQPVVSVQVVPWWDQKYYSTIWHSQQSVGSLPYESGDDDAWSGS